MVDTGDYMTPPPTEIIWQWPRPMLGPPLPRPLKPPKPPDPRIAEEAERVQKITEQYRRLIESDNELVSASGCYLRDWMIRDDRDDWFDEGYLIEACDEINRLEALLELKQPVDPFAGQPWRCAKCGSPVSECVCVDDELIEELVRLKALSKLNRLTRVYRFLVSQSKTRSK